MKSVTSLKSRSKKSRSKSLVVKSRSTSSGKKSNKSSSTRKSSSKTESQISTMSSIKSQLSASKSRSNRRQLFTPEAIIVAILLFVCLIFLIYNSAAFFMPSFNNKNASESTLPDGRYSTFCVNSTGTFSWSSTSGKSSERVQFSPVGDLYGQAKDAFKALVLGKHSKESITSLVFHFTKVDHIGTPYDAKFTCGEKLFVKYKPAGDASEVSLGTWSIPPAENCPIEKDADFPIHTSDGSLVVLIAHGRSSRRDEDSRIPLYKELTDSPNLKVHVVAFDYRSCADSSSPELSVAGVVNDTLAVYRWMLTTKSVPPKQIILWGHSLGTQVIAHTLAQLSQEETPLGAVLEASFPSILKLVKLQLENIFSSLISASFGGRMYKIRETYPQLLGFEAETQLSHIKCPLLFLGSVADFVVPAKLTEDLYETALKLQPPAVSAKTKLYLFSREENLGHSQMPKAKNLPAIVKDYFQFIYC